MADADAMRLDLQAAYPLYGVVESLATLKSRSGASQRDALILTFRDAKAVVLEWDESAHAIRTSSLHYLEDPALKEGRTEFPQPPRVATDPSGR